MQEKKDNIIQFANKNNWKQKNSSGKVLSLFDKKLFKNSTIVDLETGEANLVDILVKDGIIQKVLRSGSKFDDRTEVVDLFGSLVLPAFCDNFFMHDKILGFKWLESDIQKKSIDNLMTMKQILSGVGYFCDNIDAKMLLVDDITQYEEKTLSELSDFLAKNQDVTLFLKIGQSLEELGTVDKKFGKPLVNVLEDFGILDRKYVLVGGNYFEKDDFQIFSQYGNKIVVCPAEDAQMGRRTLNLCMLKNLGFDLTIGSGQAFEVDFFAYMRQILSSQWTIFEDNTCLSEKDVLLFATNNKKSLNVGDKANFYVMENTTSLYDNLLKCIVWGKSKKDVLFTIIEGNTAQQFGEIFDKTGLDYFRLIKKIKQTKE